MSSVLLLGGTGAMGSMLRGKLAARGYQVVVTSRSKRDDEPGVTFVEGNAKDMPFLRRVLSSKRPDAIVDFMSYSTEEFAARYRELVSWSGQYLSLSSCRVFAGEDVHTERSPRLLDVSTDKKFLKSDDYALAKARQEDLLRDCASNNWTIIRPCITYKFPRLQFGCYEAGAFVSRALAGLPVPIPEEMLAKRTTMMRGDDAAEMIARLVLNEKALGEDFNLTTAENHTWREVGEIYRELIGLSWEPCSVRAYKRIVMNPYHVQYGRMVDHCFDNTKVLEVTGLTQSDLTTLEKGLAGELKGAAVRASEIRSEKFTIEAIEGLSSPLSYYARRVARKLRICK